ncbi:MAG: hypothetical protein KF729_20005 [Sandaracinaceae bacterium]|nr:hypothetical protein [Sandaracinaceae bacterium]
MKKKTVISITVLASALSLLAVGVDAQRGRRGRRGGTAATTQQAAPQSAAIAESLGQLRWGMTPEEVHAHFRRQIEERYRPRLAKAPGAIEEDRIRNERDQEIRQLRESYVRFEGTRTGWDLSFLRGEFTHGNRESMIAQRDGNSQNFYFFIRGRLWKWFKAFDASVFQGQTFEQFAAAVQGRFGPAADRSGRLVEGGPNQRWLEWQDATTRLRAIDHNQFYGFYCLVFEDKATLDQLAQLRTNTQQPSGQGDHALVDAVLLPEGGSADSSDSNPNSDIADRITGNIRRRQDAPPGATKAPASGRGAQGGGASGGSGASGSSGSSGSSGRRGSSGGGLDLSDL